MPDDDITNSLLEDYETTASNLRNGVNVCTETLNKYHGQTGIILARVVRGLWSQHELDEQIDARIRDKCKDCANTRFIEDLKRRDADRKAGREEVEPTWSAVAKRKFGTLAWCVSAILITAIVFNQLSALGEFLEGFKSASPARTEEVSK